MKKNKIIIFGIIFSIIININSAFGDEVQTLSDKKGYDLYQERVSLFCSEYKINDNSSEMIYLIDNDNQFKNYDNGGIDINKSLSVGKDQYRKNMDDIYGCATNIVYYRSLKLIKEDLITKNPKLNGRLQNKLNYKINEIEKKIIETSNKCKITGEKNNGIIKKSVLKQVTYEYCKYNFYLEYLKEINQNNINLDEETKNNTENAKGINEVVKKVANKKKEIEKEISDTNKAFPVAFKAYSEYENNITVHILLELLREDYILLREAIHKTLNPINQVSYKISNAMRK
ncbi:hypothetical protein HUU51_02905 [Candidatus Gracilibacteria bacterium]|nr:hypothetical protein [Candidatus Gracilibacteria bacterium]